MANIQCSVSSVQVVGCSSLNEFIMKQYYSMHLKVIWRISNDVSINLSLEIFVFHLVVIGCGFIRISRKAYTLLCRSQIQSWIFRVTKNIIRIQWIS